LAHVGLILASLAFAQSDTAYISGEVTDATGAVVPGVRISVINVSTGIGRRVESNAAGMYAVPNLSPGEYRITAEKTGFKSLLRKGVVLQVDQKARQDIRLDLGSTAESIEVTAHVEQFLKPASSELGDVTSEAEIRDLPLNGRNALSLVPLTVGSAEAPPGVFQNLMGGAGFSLNGLRINSSSYTIDGFDNNNTGINSPWNILPADAIEEFSVLTNNFSAEYGRSSGGVVSMRMRSGTNAYHGSAFEFFRNDVLDANDFFSNRTGQPRAPYRYNQFGATFGGPLKRNKTFFFADYQGTRNITYNTAIGSVPILPLRTGDFTSLAVNVWDPNNVTGYNGATPVRAPFPGKIIPASAQNPVGRKIAALYPVSNLGGTFNNFVTTKRSTLPLDSADLKVDHNFSPTDIVSVRYDIASSSSFTNPMFGDAGGGGSYGQGRQQQLGATYNRTFSPTLLNEFRFLWVRGRSSVFPGTYGSDVNTQLGIPGINTNKDTSGMAWVCPAGFNCLGGDLGFPQDGNPNTFQFGDNVTLMRGRHNIKAGYSLVLRYMNFYQPSTPRGTFNFNQLVTSNGGAGGNAIASLLVGYPALMQRDILDHYMVTRGYETNAFVRDDFRVNKRLTLNLGLRWDLFMPHVEGNDRQSNFDPATRSMLLAGKDGNSRALVNADKKDFGPRVGFAYQLGKTAATVLRGGYGISYLPERDSVAQMRLPYNPPFYFFQTITQSGLLTPTRAISDGLPAPAAPDPRQPSASIQYQQPNLRNASVQYWNLDVQRALTRTLILDVAYAGNHGTHLLTLRNINQPAPGPVQVFPVSPSIGYLNTFEGRGNSAYHSLQVKLAKTYSNGLSLRASYTYAKAIDDSPGFWPVDTSARYPQDSLNYASERGLSAFDVRHRMTLNYNYDLPFGRGRKLLANASPLLNAIAGGWQVTGITVISSGLPFTPIMATNRANTANNGELRPDRLPAGGSSSFEQNIDHWFDKTAYGLPALYTYGNSGRNILTGPGRVNIDAGLFKNFKLTEKTRLQFRGEFFNLLNHAQFGFPNRFMDTAPGSSINAVVRPPRQVQLAVKILF
jgi:hypothetical protein